MTPCPAALMSIPLCTVLIACSAPPRPAAADRADITASRLARTAGAEDSRAQKATPGRDVFMLSPFGALPAAEALPADNRLRTRNGQYATRAQAEALERQQEGAVVWINVDCCTAAAIERAQGHVAGLMAAKDLPADAPVFVTGADAALAARAVDALSDQGFTRVMLVTR
jgi:hypothetical protein